MYAYRKLFEMKKREHVVFTIDKNYLEHWVVALYSLLKNNPQYLIYVHLIYDEIADEKLFTCKQFFKDTFDCTVEVYSLNSQFMDDFKLSHHVNKATYFRLCMAEVLPKEIDEVLFLDSDLIVHGSLEGLFENILHDGVWLRAVSHRFTPKQKEHLESFGLSKESDYFNAGVMQVHLKEWRDHQLSAQFLECAHTKKESILWWDQDVLNACCANRWETLPSKYNLIWEIMEAKESDSDSEEANKNPIIIHYTRSVKPWHSHSWHPYKELYWSYRREVQGFIKELM